MCRLTDCKHGNGKLGIDEALKLRDNTGERAFPYSTVPRDALIRRPT